MSDVTASSQTGNPLDHLADKLSRLVPPPAASPLAHPSPAVQAALKKSRQRAAEIARRTGRRRGSLVTSLIERFIGVCSVVPYAVIALGLRLVMARVFFVAGQTMIEGPRVSLPIPDVVRPFVNLDIGLIVPYAVKPQTFAMFQNQFSAVPLPPSLSAYLVGYAQFVLPLLLVLGLATRASALCLLVITAMIQLFVYPEALWTTHIYWIAMLAILISAGPGALSLDHLLRLVGRRRL